MYRTSALNRTALGLTLASMLAVAPVSYAERGGNSPFGFHSYQQNQHANKHAGCAKYRLSAYGGEAGFRLLNNAQDFRRVANSSVTGKICSRGHVTLELSKRHPDTHVTLLLNGREYRFEQGDRGDRVANHWFRRYIKVDLFQRSGHGSPYFGNGHEPGYQTYQGQNDRYDYYDYQRGYFSSHGNHYRPDSPTLHHGHGYFDPYYGYHNPVPWLKPGSRKHRRAHREGIVHRHKKEYYAYH